MFCSDVAAFVFLFFPLGCLFTHSHLTKKHQITLVSGEQVWRLSDAVQTTGYGNCPFMQRVQVAGEPGSTTGGVVSGGPQTKRMCSAFTFKSATGASQPGLYLQANTAGAYNSLRQNFLSIKTGATGFELATYTLLRLTNGTQINDPPVDQIIATVSFADWHRVVTTVEFVDGINQGPCPAPYESQQCYLGNDIVNIFVDGALAWQGERLVSGWLWNGCLDGRNLTMEKKSFST